MNRKFKANFKTKGGILENTTPQVKEAVELLFSSVSDDDTKEHLQVVIYERLNNEYTGWAYSTNGHILTVSSELPMQDQVEKIKLDKATLSMLSKDTNKYLTLSNHDDRLEFPDVRRVIPNTHGGNVSKVLTTIPQMFSVFEGKPQCSICFDYERELWYYPTEDTKYDSTSIIRLQLGYLSYWAGMKVIMHIDNENCNNPIIITPIESYKDKQVEEILSDIMWNIEAFRDKKKAGVVRDKNSHITFSVLMPMRK